MSSFLGNLFLSFFPVRRFPEIVPSLSGPPDLLVWCYLSLQIGSLTQTLRHFDLVAPPKKI